MRVFQLRVDFDLLEELFFYRVCPRFLYNGDDLTRRDEMCRVFDGPVDPG